MGTGGNAFRKLQPGNRMKAIPSRAWNSFIDAAERIKPGGVPGAAPPGTLADNNRIVLVQNNSGSTVPRFGIVGIDDILIAPADNEARFISSPGVMGITPTVASHTGKFVVLLEPARDGAIVRGVIGGLVTVKLAVASDGDEWADVKDSDASLLQSCSAGAAHILWKESGTGTKWAGVRLGPPATLYEAKITAKTAINGGIRWKYTLELGRWDMTSSPSTGGTWVADAGTGTCYGFNSAEDMNTFTSGTGAIGTGNTNVTQSDGTINGTSCKLVPLPVDGYVVVKPRGIDSGNRYFTIINFTNSAQ